MCNNMRDIIFTHYNAEYDVSYLIAHDRLTLSEEVVMKRLLACVFGMTVLLLLWTGKATYAQAGGLFQFGKSKDDPHRPRIKILEGSRDPLGMP